MMNISRSANRVLVGLSQFFSAGNAAVRENLRGLHARRSAAAAIRAIRTRARQP